jgi:outer membrane protein TolC
LDFFGNYGWSAIDYDNIGSSDFESWRVGVALSFTVFDGLRTSGRIMQFQSQILQNDLSRQYLENEIQLEIEKSLKELQRAYKSLEAANVAKEQANEALKVAEDNFELNAATQLEVLDSEEGVRQAELTVAQAKRDGLVSLATLKYLIGINALEDFEVE